MPWRTGSWGSQAQAQSLRRLDYFRKYAKKRNEAKKDEISEKRKLQYHTIIEQSHAESKAYYHIPIPNGQLCQECNQKLAVNRHHPDYSEPLKVEFLCISCHRKKARKEVTQ